MKTYDEDEFSACSTILSIYLYACVPVCLCVDLPAYLPACLSVCLFCLYGYYHRLVEVQDVKNVQRRTDEEARYIYFVCSPALPCLVLSCSPPSPSSTPTPTFNVPRSRPNAFIVNGNGNGEADAQRAQESFSRLSGHSGHSLSGGDAALGSLACSLVSSLLAARFGLFWLVSARLVSFRLVCAA